ncbi:MAG TPA: DsbA family protein [Terriglobales bacterium]
MSRRLLHLSCVLLCMGSLSAQQKATPPTHPTSSAAHPTTAASLPTEDTVNAFMKQMFGYDETLSWKVTAIKPAPGGLAEVDVVISNPQGQQGNKLYVTPDGKHALTGEIIPFGEHPFTEARQKLEKGINGPSRGPADAPVTIVEFSDLQCPHCKQAQPSVDKLLTEEKNVRVIFQHFPLPMHEWAQKAAYYADCVGRANNDAFWKFIQSVYDAQADINSSNADEKLKGFADVAGVKGSDAAACADKPETAGRVERSIELGKSLDVTATPTAFVNGRRVPIGANQYEVLKMVTEYAAKKGKD